MLKRVLTAMIAVSVFMGGSLLYAAETYYVQSMKAKIMATPSFRGNVLGEVNKGHKFENAVKQGTWIKVRYNNKEGFVASLLVSATAPMDKGLIKAESPEIKEGARKRASTFASAAAARGLTAEDRKRASKEEKVDYESLEQIESLVVTDKEIQTFGEAR